MFSESDRPHSRGPFARLRRQCGYSLIELMASLVLLACIAVLSFPTFQDFSPHEDAAGARVTPQSAGGEISGDPAPGDDHRPSQPVERTDQNASEEGKDDSTEEPRKA